MQFESFNEFIDMGGYGPFVWAVYGIGIAVLLYNVILPILLERRLFTEHLRLREREAHARQGKRGEPR